MFYGTDEGLSETSAEALLQDHRGFIWVATADGLNRFDGHTFAVFRNEADDPHSLSDSVVKSLFEDQNGTLWVGTDGGLNRFEREAGNFSIYRHDPGDETTLTNDIVQTITEDRTGRLWVGTYWGLNLFDPLTQSFRRYLNAPTDELSGAQHTLRIFADTSNTLWVCTDGGGLLRFDPESGHAERFVHDPADPGSLASNICRAIHEDESGRLWIATDAGLDYFDSAIGSFSHYRNDPRDPTSLSNNSVWTVFQESGGRFWVGTDGGGLNLFDRDTGRFVRFTHDRYDPSSLQSDVVRDVIEDDAGDVWIATRAGGLHFLDTRPPAFSLYAERDGMSASSTTSFAEDAKGDLWIGTGRGLNRLRRTAGAFDSWRHDPLDPGSLAADPVISTLVDRAGTVWLGTFSGGLDRYDPERDRFVHHKPESANPRSLSNANVWHILEDSRGDLWLATFGGANKMIGRSGEFEHFRFDVDDPASLASDVVWVIYEDSQERLWFGTQEGVSVLQRDTGDFENFKNLGNDSVVAICEDSEGVLWFGTRGGGLNRFDENTKTFRIYRTKDGLPSDAVVGILADEHGALWLGTRNGLSRFDPGTGAFRNYDVGDGLQGLEFNRTATYRARDGELFFGGVRGFNHFYPENVKGNPFIPPVVLTDFQVFNAPVPVGGPDGILAEDVTVASRVQLSYEHSVFSFGYAALSYRSPDHNRFAYMMEGFDEAWIDAGSRRHATYTNLDPGEYVFRVRAANNSGVWNEDGVSIQVLIQPPYWETWWFRGLTFVAVMLLLLRLHRARTGRIASRNRLLSVEIEERRTVARERKRLVAALERKNRELESKNEELERFAYTVSHDLQSPLVTIQGFLDYMEKDIEAENKERLKGDIVRIRGASRQMRNLLSDILTLSRSGRSVEAPKPVGLDELVARVLDAASGEIEERHVEVVIAPDLGTVQGDPLRLASVFQNLIQNAVHFMGDESAPRIEVGVAQRSDAEVVCFVKDNGIGLPREDQQRIFGLFTRLDTGRPGTGLGLALAARIVDVHGGRIWAESEGRGHGSTFFFSLPIAADPSNAS